MYQDLVAAQWPLSNITLNNAGIPFTGAKCSSALGRGLAGTILQVFPLPSSGSGIREW